MWSRFEITRLELPSLDISGINSTAVETSDAESHMHTLVSQIILCNFSAKEIWFCTEFGTELPMKMSIYKWYKDVKWGRQMNQPNAKLTSLISLLLSWSLLHVLAPA
jgi:hypothetical protein